HELSDDLRHQRFEALVVSPFLRIEDAMTVYDPAHVARAMRPQEVRRRRLGLWLEHALDRPHGLEQPRRGGGGAGADQAARLGERQRAFQQAFLEDANLARIKAVEPTDGLHAIVESTGLELPDHGPECGANQLTLSTRWLPENGLSRRRRRTADERPRCAPMSPCGPDPMTRGLARQFRLHWLRFLRGSRFRGLLLELADHLAEDLDQPLPLRAVARAPGRLVGALVRKLVLHARHLGRIAVGVELGDHLVREDVPVVSRAEGRTRAFRRPSLPPLDDRILELPLVGRDLLLRPV